MNSRRIKRNVIRSIQLIKSIHNRLERNPLVQANTPLLLALSGGQDSITMVCFLLQIKNQRRYKIGWCWCNHLWRYDVFHTMHHLMRLAFTVGERISFLIEPTIDPEGEENYLEKGDGPPFRTFDSLRTDLLFCESKERYVSALSQRGKGKDLLVSRPPFMRRAKREKFFSRQRGEPFFPHCRRQQGGWIVEESTRSQDYVSTSSASSMLNPKKMSLSYVEAVGVTKTNGHGERNHRKWSFTEAGARRSRYQLCQRLATFHRYRILQVGHTASDRIETGVFHLLRGSGMRGVAGIQRSRIFKKLYPKRFCFSNFYAIDFEQFEDNQERCQYHQKRANLPHQRKGSSLFDFVKQRGLGEARPLVDPSTMRSFAREQELALSDTVKWRSSSLFDEVTALRGGVQPFFHQESCQRSISFETWKVTTRLKKKEMRPPRLIRLMRTGRCTVKGLRKPNHLPYGVKKTRFFYSVFLERKNETLLLYRPLLSVSRSDARRVCHLWQLPLYPDASNQTCHYVRNRIRNQLLPTLRFQFNRQVDGTLFQFTTLLSTEQLYLDSLSQRLFPFICVVAKDYIAFHVAGLNRLPLVIRRQILKQTLEKYATQSLHLSHIETLFQFFEKKRPRFAREASFAQHHQFLGTSCLFLFSRRKGPGSMFQKRSARNMEQDSKATNLFEDKLVSFFFPFLPSIKRAEGSERSEIKRRVIQDQVISSQQGGRKKVFPSLLPLAKRGGRWKECFIMPTHRFLPTIGSFLFLGER